ncbi:MAG: hypothetical protein ABH956_02800 [Candidatus Nealsonbacteria bacterium]
MKKKRRKPANRLPQFLQKSPVCKEDQEVIKGFFQQTAENKKADKLIRNLQGQFPGKSLLQLLPVMIRRYGDKKIIKKVVERIERNQGDKLTLEDRAFLNQVKKGLEENEKEEETCHRLGVIL